jgi:tetratricopeptide (TPR) repeat protein
LFSYALGKLGRYDEALVHLNYVNAKFTGHLDYLYLTGLILIQISRYEDAANIFRKCLRRVPDNWKYLRETGFCLTRMGAYDSAYRLLKRAEAKRPNQLGILISLAENRFFADKSDAADRYIDRFVEIVGVSNIENMLIEDMKDLLSLPFSYNALIPHVLHNISERSEKYLDVVERLSQHSAID